MYSDQWMRAQNHAFGQAKSASFDLMETGVYSRAEVQVFGQAPIE
jgi:hypothetical protein